MSNTNAGNNNMLWAKIVRKNTGSVINYKLPWRMEFLDIEEYMKKEMPEWIVTECSIHNPNTIDI